MLDLQASDGPIDAPKTVADVRQEPYGLPQKCAVLLPLVLLPPARRPVPPRCSAL